MANIASIFHNPQKIKKLTNEQGVFLNSKLRLKLSPTISLDAFQKVSAVAGLEFGLLLISIDIFTAICLLHRLHSFYNFILKAALKKKTLLVAFWFHNVWASGFSFCYLNFVV